MTEKKEQAAHYSSNTSSIQGVLLDINVRQELISRTENEQSMATLKRKLSHINEGDATPSDTQLRSDGKRSAFQEEEQKQNDYIQQNHSPGQFQSTPKAVTRVRSGKSQAKSAKSGKEPSTLTPKNLDEGQKMLDSFTNLVYRQTTVIEKSLVDAEKDYQNVVKVEQQIKKQHKSRIQEELDFEQHQLEAQQLLQDIREVDDPVESVYKNFNLHNLKACQQEAFAAGSETRAGESSQGTRKASILIRDDIRSLNSNQRQLYIRQQLKSQNKPQRHRRHISQIGSQTNSGGGQFMDSRLMMEKANSSLSFNQQHMMINNEGGNHQRAKSRGEFQYPRDSNVGLDPSKGLFKKSANATHHFFKNQNQQAFHLQMQMSNQSSTVTVNNDQKYPYATKFDQIEYNRELDNHQAAMSSNNTRFNKSNRRTKVISTIQTKQDLNSTDFNSSAMSQVTANHLPMKSKNNKLAAKGLKRQLAAKSHTREHSKERRDTTQKVAALYDSSSYNNKYFEENSKPKTAQAKTRIARDQASAQQYADNFSSFKNGLTQKMNSSRDQSLPLNRFNANHEVMIKPMSFYDSTNQTQVSFPSKAIEKQAKIISSIQSDTVIQKPAQPKRETVIVKQIEKDLFKLKEQLMQGQMDRENQQQPQNAKEEQELTLKEQQKAISDFKKVCDVFWRFSLMPQIADDVVKNFESAINLQNKQYAQYVEEVQGQFYQIGLQMEEQKKISKLITIHLDREEAFRKKVFNRETSEVMTLIREYENIPTIQNPKASREFDYKYSDLEDHLQVMQKHMKNAISGLDRLKDYTIRHNMATPSIIIDDMLEEKKQVKREIQVNTASRVLKRFWVNKDDRKEKECQTDTDQISLFRNTLDSQIDVLMDREIDIKNELQLWVKKNTMLQNRISLQEKKIEELNDIIQGKTYTIDEMTIQYEKYKNEFGELERQLMFKNRQLEEYKNVVTETQKTSFNRLKDAEKLRQAMKELQKKCDDLIDIKMKAESDLLKSLLNNGNQQPIIDDLEAQRQKLKDEIAELEKELQEATVQASKAEIQIAQLIAKLDKAKIQLKQKQQNSNIKKQNSIRKKSETPEKVVNPEIRIISNQGSFSGSRQNSMRRGSETSVNSNLNKDKKNNIMKTVYGVQKNKKALFSSVTESRVSSATHQLIDGKCPKCLIKISVESQIKKDTPEVKIIKQFENMILGRRRTIFKNVFAEITEKVNAEQVKDYDDKRDKPASKDVSVNSDPSLYKAKPRLRQPGDRLETQLSRRPSTSSLDKNNISQTEQRRRTITFSKDASFKVKNKGVGRETQYTSQQKATGKGNSNWHQDRANRDYQNQKQDLRDIKYATQNINEQSKKQKSQSPPKIRSKKMTDQDKGMIDLTYLLSHRMNKNFELESLQRHSQMEDVNNIQSNHEGSYRQNKPSPRISKSQERQLERVTDEEINGGNLTSTDLFKIKDKNGQIYETHLSDILSALRKQEIAHNNTDGRKAAEKFAGSNKDIYIKDRLGKVHETHLDNITSAVRQQQRRRSVESNGSQSYKDKRLNSQNSQKFKRSIQTQTSYGASDVQFLFLRRLDELLGSKIYHPIQSHGQPSQPRFDEDDDQQVIKQQSAYQVGWRKSPTKVKNVSNVNKMRKFEPLRKRQQEMMHRAENEKQYHQEDQDSDVSSIDEQEYQYEAQDADEVNGQNYQSAGTAKRNKHQQNTTIRRNNDEDGDQYMDEHSIHFIQNVSDFNGQKQDEMQKTISNEDSMDDAASDQKN